MNPSSNTTTAAAGNGSNNATNGSGNNNVNGGSQCTVREQDRFMPIANVIRIMRKVLPPHAKISDDAKETIQECVSEYISFITSEANERCQREQRKTITAEDVLWAMSKLGFDDYVEPLGIFLRRYRDLEGDHRGSIRGEPFQAKRAAVGSEGGGDRSSSAVGMYGLPPQLQGGYHIPATEPRGHHHHHHHRHVGIYGSVPCEGVGGGYYMGVYGDPETGSSQVPAAKFDPYGYYK